MDLSAQCGAGPAKARQQLAIGSAEVSGGTSEALSESVRAENPTLSEARLDLLGETKLLIRLHLEIGPTEKNVTVLLSPLFSMTSNATLVMCSRNQRRPAIAGTYGSNSTSCGGKSSVTTSPYPAVSLLRGMRAETQEKLKRQVERYIDRLNEDLAVYK